jgi:2-keto-3-deoxy-L-fuconate dehydrogenase
MVGRLQGKLAFCTAAGAGIGRATAIGFAKEGARVIATDVDESKLTGLAEESIAERLRLNVRSMHRTIRAFLPGMLQKGTGSIVNVASTAGSIRGVPNRYVYGATKAAVIGLTKAVAIDFIRQGIRCNAICPGTIQSPSLEDRIVGLGKTVGGAEKARQMFIDRQPMGRLGTPEEVAALAVYLASDESAFTTGTAVLVDGGFTL